MSVELSENLVSVEISKDNYVVKDTITTLSEYPLYAIGTVKNLSHNVEAYKTGQQVILPERFKDFKGEILIIPLKEILGFYV